ncbi:hypothetical protein H6G93_16610 [Nostoc sp. FACHB-973]|nr:hypothetical protein [Nostoc sp. FACHB-973]MBX9252687.1 hypothetical protein [Desmonostoc muscorum CCALA 125]
MGRFTFNDLQIWSTESSGIISNSIGNTINCDRIIAYADHLKPGVYINIGGWKVVIPI